MSTQRFSETLLNAAIAGLDLSDNFKAIAELYQYETLGDMLRMGRPHKLLQHPGFDTRVFFEFTHILCINGLGDYLN